MPTPRYRMFLHSPTVVFRARVNLVGSVEYPVQYIPYTDVTIGDETDIKPGMTVIVGTTLGSDNHGRQRVRLAATSISIFIGISSQGIHDGELTLQSGDWIEVWDDRRIWAKIPVIDNVGNIYKDTNLEVEDRTTEPPPVAAMGTSGLCGTAVGGVLQFNFDGTYSFAVAPGATIASYFWEFGDGVIVDFDDTSATPGVEFEPGFRYIKLTVTDSNGKTSYTERPIFVDNETHTLSFDGFDIEKWDVSDIGQAIDLKILRDIPKITYPDGTLCMIWEREPIDPSDRNHMVIVGWEDEESAQHTATRHGVRKNTSISILDAAGRLDQLPGFPQNLSRDETRDTELVPEITWNYYVGDVNLKIYIIYILMWHSTALEIIDFIFDYDASNYKFVMLGSDGSSLWDQADRRAKAFVPSFCLTCDRQGRILVVPDPMNRDAIDRTDVIQAVISEADWMEIEFKRKRHPKSHWTKGEAVAAGTTQPIGTFFCRAPGMSPGQGPGEITHGEQLALTQEALNISTGHRHARDNSEFSSVTITVIVNDAASTSLIPWRIIEPAFKEWITLDISEDNAAYRGITWADQRLLPLKVSVSGDRDQYGLKRTIVIDAEVETFGTPGETEEVEQVPDVNEPPPVFIPVAPPPMLVEGEGEIVGIGYDGHAYRTSDFTAGSPTWDEVDLGVGPVYSWVVDPFCSGYSPESPGGTIDGFLATESSIYKVTDLFGTPVVDEILLFANDAAMSNFCWRTIQCTFGRFFDSLNPWILVVTNYKDLAGHEGTWSTYSVDGGATWSTEVQISPDYTLDSDSKYYPIGIYASPKTPGLAYTIAQGLGDTTGLPTWVFIDNDDVLYNAGQSRTYTINRLVTDLGGPGAYTISEDVMIAPPLGAARVTLHGNWSCTFVRSGGSLSAVFQINSTPTSVDVTHNLAFTHPPGTSGTGGTTSGTFSANAPLDTPYSTNNWPGTENQIGTGAGNNSSDFGIAFNYIIAVDGVLNSARLQVTITVDEIEMENGTIYTFPQGDSAPYRSTNWGEDWELLTFLNPEQGNAGAIHIPWPDNDFENIIYYGQYINDGTRRFRLIRNSGTTIDDISPDGVKGINRYGFSIRTYDSDRSYVVASLVGNETSSSPSDDEHSVAVSSDAGNTWTEIVTPIADSSAPAGRAAFEAAFANDNPDVIYIWGPAAYMKYTDDFGGSVDDKSGNLAALGCPGFVGIAGGPT